MSVLDRLLDLQERDTTLDQLRHRRDHLAERAALDELSDREQAHAARAAEVTTQRDELVRTQRRKEDEIAALESKIAEVDGQLYGGGVSSPRELQALQDEIAALGRRKSDLEDEVLESMTELEPIEETLEALDAEAAARTEERTRLEAALAAGEAEVDAEIGTVTAERSALASEVPAARLSEYEVLRGQMGGIAIARLVGTSCGGCHLALSAVDLDRIRKLPPDEPGVCEECGRLLVH